MATSLRSLVATSATTVPAGLKGPRGPCATAALSLQCTNLTLKFVHLFLGCSQFVVFEDVLSLHLVPVPFLFLLGKCIKLCLELGDFLLLCKFGHLLPTQGFPLLATTPSYFTLDSRAIPHKTVIIELIGPFPRGLPNIWAESTFP